MGLLSKRGLIRFVNVTDSRPAASGKSGDYNRNSFMRTLSPLFKG
jgi:hypothetical protein